MPKNQDISKLFDKADGAEREVIGKNNSKGIRSGQNNMVGDDYKCDGYDITAPSTELAKKWNGWKTAGLKPAHEPITIFQKPIDGIYIDNIKNYGCGGMNIDACRIPISKADIDMLNAKASKNPTTNYSDRDDKVYGSYAEDKAMPANELGRFPCNMIIDEYVAEMFNEQTGVSKSAGGKNGSTLGIYGEYNSKNKGANKEGFGDVGGGSKNLTVIKYNPKVSPSERKLPNGERNPHVTLKPVELIKWLIKLLTPIDGTTIDITAGSCTHAVACEDLNKNSDYSLKYIDIELMNTEDDPYCSVGKMRVKAV
jgi:site-specific DNA-methyltransferase (adenine-specific)